MDLPIVDRAQGSQEEKKGNESIIMPFLINHENSLHQAASILSSYIQVNDAMF